MIKTIWTDPETGKEYGYNWGLTMTDIMPPIRRVENPEIKKVIFNDPATIVLWSDGTKTVVKCSENDEFDPEKGLAMAISKKFFGNKGNYYENFKKWLPDESLPILIDTEEAEEAIVQAAISTLDKLFWRYFQ